MDLRVLIGFKETDGAALSEQGDKVPKNICEIEQPARESFDQSVVG